MQQRRRVAAHARQEHVVEQRPVGVSHEAADLSAAIVGGVGNSAPYGVRGGAPVTPVGERPVVRNLSKTKRTSAPRSDRV